MKRVLFAALVLYVAALSAPPCEAGETIFLDNRAGIVNGSTSYHPASRTCGAGSFTVYDNLADAADALRSGVTLNIRSGTYSRPSVGNYKTVHVPRGSGIRHPCLPNARKMSPGSQIRPSARHTRRQS